MLQSNKIEFIALSKQTPQHLLTIKATHSMSLTDPLIKKSQHFTFSPDEVEPTNRREIKIDIPECNAEDIHIIGQDECVCCPAEGQAHYSLVIYVGMIAYVAGFLTCLYFWPCRG